MEYDNIVLLKEITNVSKCDKILGNNSSSGISNN